MTANVNVPVVDSSDTNTDGIIPETFRPAEDIIVDVAISVASINIPARDDMIISGMPPDVEKSGANKDTYPALDDKVTNEIVAVDNMVTQTEYVAVDSAVTQTEDVAEETMYIKTDDIETTDDMVIGEDVPDIRENQLTDDNIMEHPGKHARTEAYINKRKQADKINHGTIMDHSMD